MANRRGFIDFNPDAVASGLKRMVDQGIATDVGGIPSFNNDSIALFLQLHGQQAPGTFPETTPVEDAPPRQTIDPSLTFSANTQGLIEIDSRIADIDVRKNQIATQNLTNMQSDPEVAAARAELTDITSTRMFSFGVDPAEQAALDARMSRAQANLATSEQRARGRIETQTAIDVAELDNERTRLVQRRASNALLIAEAKENESNLPVGLQTTISAAERVALAEVDKVWDTLDPGKKLLYSEATSLPKGDFFNWSDPIIEFDRDGYTSLVRSRLKIGTQTESFDAMLPQMNKDLAVARTKAQNEMSAMIEADPTQADVADADTQAAWIANRTSLIMQENVESAWTTFVTGVAPEALPRDRFSSDAMWEQAKIMQELIDPTQPDIASAVTEVLARAPDMDPEFRNLLVAEYLRVHQTVFNEPRNPFGMGMEQTTVDVMVDAINSRAITVDRIKARASIIADDMGALNEDALGERAFIGEPSTVFTPRLTTRQQAQGRRQAALASTSQTALDVAAGPTRQVGGGGGLDSPGSGFDEAAIRQRAATIHTLNPGLNFEEAMGIAIKAAQRVGPIAAQGVSDTLSILGEEISELSGAAADEANALLESLRRVIGADDATQRREAAERANRAPSRGIRG